MVCHRRGSNNNIDLLGQLRDVYKLASAQFDTGVYTPRKVVCGRVFDLSDRQITHTRRLRPQ